MFPVQVYHRACTIGMVSMVSAAALVQGAGQVGFDTISKLSKLMAMASRLNMAGVVDTARYGDAGYSENSDRGGGWWL